MNLKKTMLDCLRKAICGENPENFTFSKTENLNCPELSSTDIYIHIPFCRNKCPYCPYNTVPYRDELVSPFFRALKIESEIYAEALKNADVRSIYIGGGTPTTVWPELAIFLRDLRKNLGFSGDIAIETTPEEVTEKLVKDLSEAGVTQVSLGVQSFRDEALKIIGRKYSASILDEKIKMLAKGGFDNVNIDLIFAFGNEPEKSFRYDLEHALASGADQITAYPLFEFPYTKAGQLRKLKKLQMPDLGLRKRMYEILCDTMRANAYEMVSVWGFRKRTGQEKIYSSVSRDFFVGMGPGAASRLKDRFIFNTFDLNAYQKRLTAERKLPYSLEMPLSKEISDIYWLYWRFYEGSIPQSGFQEKFAGKSRIKIIISILRLLHLLKSDGTCYRLTDSGAFWIHLLQNHYILNYIDKVWTRSMKEAYPDKIRL